MNKNNKLEYFIEQRSIARNLITLTEEEIFSLENSLNVELSYEFISICKKCSYEEVDVFEFHSFPRGTIEYTKIYREKGLPHRYIILADQGDAGVILLETQDDREKPSPVIWCDYPDISNLCECGEFKLNPDIWPSFTDFFEYLIEREEKIQNEELN